MTKFLSEALEASEPYFRRGILELEAANGNPSTDIRFSTEINQATKQKLKQLGLDPNDTTPKELYGALQEQVRLDDHLLTKKLRTIAATNVSAEAEVVAGMVEVLKDLPDSKRCFALKWARLKTLLKTEPPKKAMRHLHYRSLDSMLKHENPVLILTAAWLSESQSWQKRFMSHYKHLSPADFEERTISLLQPTEARWRELSRQLVERHKHNLISFKELGALVLLPLPRDVPDGVITASLCLALFELNEIRAYSSFLKLSQVKANFGHIVAEVTITQPELNSKLLDQPVPWHLIQRYYAQLKDRFKEDVFEPYVRLEDMVWQPIEQALVKIEPSLGFWQDSAHLGVTDSTKPVSLNIIDSALNLCNARSFEQRISHYFKQSLWHELLMRYLQHEPVEQTVLSELQPQLATESALG